MRKDRQTDKHKVRSFIYLLKILKYLRISENFDYQIFTYQLPGFDKFNVWDWDGNFYMVAYASFFTNQVILCLTNYLFH